MFDTTDFIPADQFLSNSEVEEMEAARAGVTFHEGYLDDLAAFEGMGR